MILPDVILALSFIEELRSTQGKTDVHKIRNKQIEENVKIAMKNKTQVARKNVNEDVK